MPTLKLIASLDTKEGVSHGHTSLPSPQPHQQSRCGLTRPITKEKTSDDSDDDERFSQESAVIADAMDKWAFSQESVPRKDLCRLEQEQLENAHLSIASAITNYRKRNDANHEGSSGIATDIVAVVLSSATAQPSVPMMTSKSKASRNSIGPRRTHLLVGDNSLPNGKCARVSISENAQAALSERLGQLQPGDIVRWNHLEIRKYYEDEESGLPEKKRKLAHDNSKKGFPRHNNRHGCPLMSVVCDLWTSWRDPAAGPSLARLCRIIPKASNDGRGLKHQSCDSYDLEWENVIPLTMDTSKEFVIGLASWYCSNAMPNCKTPTALPTHQPCQRRRLREITTPNILSHVVVKVLRCEKAIPTFSTPCKAMKGSVLTHVTLSDGAESDDLLGMGGSVNPCSTAGAISYLPKSISTILLQSMKEGSYVLLTQTLSQSTVPGGASLHSREALVLVPTIDTTATIISRDHPYYPVHNCFSREEANVFASQPLTLERASQLYSMTQQNSPQFIDAPASQCRGMMAIAAPLMDIIVDGIDASFMEGLHWQNPHKLSKFLIDSPSISTGMKAIQLSPSYRSATLILDPSNVSRDIVVNADGNALKLLCMDVPVEDMVPTDVAPNPYLCHVGELLRALCSESIPIRWVLEQESECNWFVTNATLLEI
eukprot:CAMPEP_0183748824 /NCGR_PEP_ID=MMETSP0737-20130205/67971_1 /TAXON_ID=385413 /ORGANISM="Thalassiosira miniscula, Strain CCMP1093" /LENGTH=657 /DNA_ID=CAMNT_0025984563 /DNA_START=135 /DNA_END=2107 /DNA_ORIENTATION=+